MLQTSLFLIVECQLPFLGSIKLGMLKPSLLLNSLKLLFDVSDQEGRPGAPQLCIRISDITFFTLAAFTYSTNVAEEAPS